MSMGGCYVVILQIAVPVGMLVFMAVGRVIPMTVVGVTMEELIELVSLGTFVV